MLNYGSLKPKDYMSRHVDSLIANRLEYFGALEISGTKWCGKSWSAAAFANSIVYVDEIKSLIEADPSLALLGEKPHVIDEWQDVPQIWNYMRHAVDNAETQKGGFMLTGSSAPPNHEERHSGAGRVTRIRMKTMTMQELGLSSGEVSLQGLFNGTFESTTNALQLTDYAESLCRGGWPGVINVSTTQAQVIVQEYLELLFNISMPAQKKDPSLSRRIALALGRNLGTGATLKTLAKDAQDGGSRPLESTIREYINCFSNNYFTDELTGWDAPVRSKSRVRTKPKRYFDDPSMGIALLGVDPSRLLKDGQLFGLTFENLCHHELSVYAQLLENAPARPLHYYGDADGLEVDFVIELRDGRWAAIEVKLGEDKVESAAQSLQRLKRKTKANAAARNAEPAFMAVLVGSGQFAYRRKDDGIYVVPLGCLGV